VSLSGAGADKVLAGRDRRVSRKSKTASFRLGMSSPMGLGMYFWES
jgi:hypothetical protein